MVANMRFVRLLLVCICGTAPTLHANLVINGDFESYSTCPASFGNLADATGWSLPTSSGSTDYFNSCSGSGFFGTPANAWGTQVPASGNGYAAARVAGIVPPNTTFNYREYLQGTLVAPLTAGETYHLSFLVSLAEVSNYSISSLGAYFSTTQIFQTINSNNNLLALTPQFVNTSGILSSFANWMTVQGDYVSAGGEQYVILGNFQPDVGVSSGSVSVALYYFDDVMLTAAVPEPPTLSLVGLAMATLACSFAIRRTRRAMRH
jgi:OOP family OmpA-OmpF porin